MTGILEKISYSEEIPKLEILMKEKNTLFNSGKWKEVIDVCNKIMNYYPDTNEAQIAKIDIAECYYKLQEFDNAINAFKELLNSPSYEWLRLYSLKRIIIIYQEMKKYNSAIEECQNFIKM